MPGVSFESEYSTYDSIVLIGWRLSEIFDFALGDLPLPLREIVYASAFYGNVGSELCVAYVLRDFVGCGSFLGGASGGVGGELGGPCGVSSCARSEDGGAKTNYSDDVLFDGKFGLLNRRICTAPALARVSILAAFGCIAAILIIAGLGRIISGNDCGPLGMPGIWRHPHLLGGLLLLSSLGLCAIGAFVLAEIFSRCA